MRGNISIIRLLLATVLFGAGFGCSTNKGGRGVHHASEDLVFFAISNYDIPWKHNLQLSMIQPQKFGDNPVLPRGPKGSVDEFGVQFYGSIIEHEGKYKMWY